MSTKYPAYIQSVDRAITLLEALDAAGGEMSLVGLCREAQLSKSTAYGLLSTLQHRGLVGRTVGGAYTLGLRLFELGSSAVARLDLRVQATDVLREMALRFGETAHLVTRDGADVVYIDKVESEHSMRIVSQVGQRLPATCTGVGKAILANLPEQQLDALLSATDLQRFTKNTITDKTLFRAHLRDVKQRGYSIDDEEIFDGLRCVAAPIFDHTGACIGALSLSGPSVRIGLSRISDMIPAVCAYAQKVAQRLGYHTDHAGQ